MKKEFVYPYDGHIFTSGHLDHHGIFWEAFCIEREEFRQESTLGRGTRYITRLGLDTMI